MTENTEMPEQADAPPAKQQDTRVAARSTGPRPQQLDEREERVLEKERKPMGPPPAEGEGAAPEADAAPPDVPPTAPEPGPE